MREQENPEIVGRLGRELAVYEDPASQQLSVVEEKEAKVCVAGEEEFSGRSVAIFGSQPLVSIKNQEKKPKAAVIAVEEETEAKPIRMAEEDFMKNISIDLKKQAEKELKKVKKEEDRMFFAK